MKKQVVVVGGGASGLMAGIHAAKAGADVTIVEHMDRVGKKILSTGNGKCNLTNYVQNASCYRSDNKDFPWQVFKQFDAEKTICFFEELGLFPKVRQGYVYPHSEQAAAVLELLRMEAARLGISVVCQCEVTGIRKRGKKLSVLTSLKNFEADAVILAAGSKAAPVTGSDGSGYSLARSLGHHIIKPLPALVQLRCSGKEYKHLAGIRTEAKLTLLVNDRVEAEEQGELQLTDYGISGIPTFQISRFASKALDQKKQVIVEIDFLPKLSFQETKELLEHRRLTMGNKTGEEFLIGLFHKKLAEVLLKQAGISARESIKTAKPQEMERLTRLVKCWEAKVTETNPFPNAQVCCGGVDTREIDPATMESRLVKGVFLAGELLDVDGICGGYNLQWAWSSGAIAGIHAGENR